MKKFVLPTILFPLEDHNAVFTVRLLKPYSDYLGVTCRNVLSDEGSLYGKLGMSSVDEAEELDPRGSAEVGHRVHRGSRGAAGEDHVVDQDYGLAGHVKIDLSAGEHRLFRDSAQVVAVERYVERADRNLNAGYIENVLPDPLCKRNAARGRRKAKGAIFAYAKRNASAYARVLFAV